MDFLSNYYLEIYLFFVFVILVLAFVMTNKRNKSIMAKYEENIEMYKTMMERQMKIIEIAEEGNRLLGEILKAVKK
jgi:hypothetical protein